MILLQIVDHLLFAFVGQQSISLTYQGKNVAIARDIEFYEHRKEERCARQFGIVADGHPYIKVAN